MYWILSVFLLDVFQHQLYWQHWLCTVYVWAMWSTGARFTALQKRKLAVWLLPPPSPRVCCQQPWHICACPACLVPTTPLSLFSPECTQRPWERRLNTVWHNLHSLLDNLKTWKDSLSLDSRNSFLSRSISKENTRWGFYKNSSSIIFCLYQ